MGIARNLSQLLALLLLVACGVVATGAPASAACGQSAPALDQQAKRAGAVFTGTVSDRHRRGSQVVYTVGVDRIYKGDVGEEAAVTTPRKARRCGLPALEVGNPYVFFATADGDRLGITSDGGTAPATDARVARVERLLGAGTSPTPPEPVEATFTMVAGETTTLARLAAPGVALVIVGLLGLLLVAGLARRRA
jgi:hypothetical protein